LKNQPYRSILHKAKAKEQIEIDWTKYFVNGTQLINEEQKKIDVYYIENKENCFYLLHIMRCDLLYNDYYCKSIIFSVVII
jgi:hypothetical protein